MLWYYTENFWLRQVYFLMEEGSCSDAVPRNQLNTTDKSGVVLSVFGVGYALFRFVGEVAAV